LSESAAAAIVEVRAMAGDPSHPAAQGPAALTTALSAAGHSLPVRRVAVPPSGGDTRTASLAVAVETARQSRAAVRDGELPLVLAGSCDVAPGVLAGIRDPRIGVVWIDAHADFNTPSSSLSGFWPGMTLAVVVGDCGGAVWSAVEWKPVAPENVALVGVRDLSPPEEAERLARSSIHVVPWRDGTAGAPVDAALSALAERVDRVYVHLDLDALDPSIGSAVVDPPVAGGLSAAQLDDLLRLVCERFDVAGATIATYSPTHDDGTTLAVAVLAAERLLG
jgi:arginase